MTQKQAIQLFEERKVRTAWDSDKEKWYFSLVDVVAVLTDSKNPTDYLKKLRKREPELAQGWGQIVTPLTIASPGGPQKTNCADWEGITRIIQFIPSPKAEQFLQWLGQFAPAPGTFESYEQLSDIEEFNGEVILYQPDETIRMEVRLENETVWLTQTQIMDLFQSSKANISEHIANIYEQGELVYGATVRNFRTVQKEGNRTVTRTLTYYNLDAIISIGFRVNAKRGIRFRQWANGVIRNYLLRGYAVNQQLRSMEQRFDTKLDAQQRQIQKIEATIYTEHVGQPLTHLQQLSQQQYGRRTELREYNSRFHDRFLILDDALYHFGASFKDLGKRLFAFERMGIDKEIIMNQL